MAAPVDSLVLCSLFELMGGPGGTPSDIPELVNAAGQAARFRLVQPGSLGNWSLGEPQPVTDLVQSLLLDGERPFGARSSNRTVTLPVLITAPDWSILAAARELLMQAVDAQTFTMTFTSGATGLTTVFDCFRALPAVYSYGFQPGQVAPISMITLTFQALPYGRSHPTALTSVAFASPVVGGVAAPPAPVVLDDFTAVISAGHWSSTSTQFVVGPHAARYTPPAGGGAGNPAVYTKTGLTANITGLPVLSMWFGQSWDTADWRPWASLRSDITLRWTLTDNLGHTLTFHRTVNKVPWSNNANAPKWTRISAAIPQGSAVFNYAQVTGYSVNITNFTGAGGVPGQAYFILMNAWMDHITANPPSLAFPASQRGVTYNVMGAAGTARTPVSCQFQLPRSGAVTQLLEGSGQWWPPVGVTSVKAECIGGGGAGGALTATGLGGGGGGGEYAAEPALVVTPGTPVPFTSGAGGQSGATQQVVTFTSTGYGNWLCPAGVTTVKAECWGSGAAGAFGGGGGGGGEYAAEAAVAVTPGFVYPFTVGTPGTNITWDLAHGYNSSFSGDSVTVTAHGGTGGLAGGTTGGTGGSGSTNTTHFNGGNGGTSPAAGGGGGGSSGGTLGAGGTGGAGSGVSGGAGAAAVTGGGAGGAGANQPGLPVAGGAPGGGGGGGNGSGTGGTIAVNGPGANGATGQVRLTYTVAAGAPVNGGSSTFGSVLSSGVVVTAHGGASAALNSATGGAGGTGSANTTHNNGGAGGLGGTNGGGGGGSGGSAAAGNAGTAGASGGAGATAVLGGGKGAAGATVAATAGTSASPHGGGGGGGDSTGTTVAGGNGGAGRTLVTHSPPLAFFSTLIAHRPGPGSPDTLNPCVPINNTNDTPTGIEYAVPTLTPGTNAMFNGTYTVVLSNFSWDSPSMTRIITVTVTQYEYGGAPGSQQTMSYPLSVSRTVTPATDVVNGIVIMGELTLPVKEVDPSNTSGYFTVSVIDTDSNDQFLDVLFLDTQGSTVIINLPGNQYTNYFISEPTPERDLGLILGSDLDLSQAVSVMDGSIISGSPFYIVPGDNLFFCYTPQGAPNLGLNYLNRWYLERLS